MEKRVDAVSMNPGRPAPMGAPSERVQNKLDEMLPKIAAMKAAGRVALAERPEQLEVEPKVDLGYN